MKKALKLVVLPALLVALLLVVAANLLAEPADSLPAPDPSRPITLPDGRVEPLGQLLARLSAEQAAREEVDALVATEATVDPAAAAPDGAEVRRAAAEAEAEAVLTHWPPPLDQGDVFELGRHAMHEGRTEEALALLLSVPPEHGQYSRAQRYVGWELLTKTKSEPRLGLAYVNQSLRADPLDGNGWQDAARVYLATLGLDGDLFR